jgi:hypothetical protein
MRGSPRYAYVHDQKSLRFLHCRMNDSCIPSAVMGCLRCLAAMKLCTPCRPTVPLQGLVTIWESRHCTPTYRRPKVAVLLTIFCITIAQGWRPAYIYLQRRRAGQTALDSFKVVCRSVLPDPAYHGRLWRAAVLPTS